MTWERSEAAFHKKEGTMNAEGTEIKKTAGERHILLALDESENAKRVVLYVADFLGGVPGFRVTLLKIIPEPPEDYFENDRARKEWIENEREKGTAMLENFHSVLVHSGFRNDQVSTVVKLKPCPSVADCILEEQQRLHCCTVVLGRRGISRKEEFIFGSTSSKVLHSGKNCAVWVIE